MATCLVSSDTSELRSLCAELDRLESGGASGEEFERLQAELYRLTPPDEESWINLDPQGRGWTSA